MVAEAHRAGLRSCFVVARHLRLARYVAIACLGFPHLFRRSINDVGLGWVGCCAAFAVVYYVCRSRCYGAGQSPLLLILISQEVHVRLLAGIAAICRLLLMRCRLLETGEVVVKMVVCLGEVVG